MHGDIDALAGRRSNPGCLGKFVALPDVDLVTYIKFNHTLSPLFLGKNSLGGQVNVIVFFSFLAVPLTRALSALSTAPPELTF